MRARQLGRPDCGGLNAENSQFCFLILGIFPNLASGGALMPGFSAAKTFDDMPEAFVSGTAISREVSRAVKTGRLAIAPTTCDSLSSVTPISG